MVFPFFRLFETPLAFAKFEGASEAPSEEEDEEEEDEEEDDANLKTSRPGWAHSAFGVDRTRH